MDKTLVILAAGMGSRFGGLKQITPIGPNDEFIIDYSIYDAIKAGFNKVVFIIKEENLNEFKETIGERIEKYIKTEYVFQNTNDIDEKYHNLKYREKPLGTAHAILCCKDKVHEPFLVINADDFYSHDAYRQAMHYLEEMDNKEKPYNYGMIVYQVENTISKTGSVKRGVCSVVDDKLEGLIESKVERVNDKIIAQSINGGEPYTVEEGTPVNMNVLVLDETIFPYLEDKFSKFLERYKDDSEKCEFLIPELLFQAKEDNYARIDAIDTNGTWYGVTYKEDAPQVKESIKTLIKRREYPENLWK